MKFLEFVLLVSGAILASFGLMLIFATLTDYNPPDVVELKVEGHGMEGAPSELSIMTWNIGYAGLGKDEDFFLDGGKKTRPDPEASSRYIEGILDFIGSVSKDLDVVFLQEVDRDSDRSYHVDQFSLISKRLEGFYGVFTVNYKVSFVPVPFSDPMGKVLSGLAVFSRYRPLDAKRLALPGKYPWPTKIFQLDRCAVVIRIPAPNGKEWVLINTHNSAYDEGGEIRMKQLEFLKELMLSEYEKGNYVVVGGDWNAMLGGEFEYTERKPDVYIPLPSGWTPKGWKWGIDTDVPTNRSVSMPYRKGVNFVTIIDGFLVSPNVEILEVHGEDLGFEYSDHNPVFIKVRASM